MYFECTLWTPNPLERDGWQALAHVCVEADELFAKADTPNATGERWITLHPHGDKEAKGFPVKIKEHPDGTAHVVSGPGELRGLRLTRLASNEELQRRKKERDEAKRQARSKEAAKPEHLTPEAMQQHQEQQQQKAKHLDSLASQMRELRSKLLDQAAALTGDEQYQSPQARATTSEESYDDYKEGMRSRALAAADTLEDLPVSSSAVAGAGSMIASQNVRQINSGLRALRRNLIGTLVKDSALRAAVLGEGDELELPEERTSSTPGYKRDVTGQAARHGFTAADAQQEAVAAFRDRLAKIRANKDYERADAIQAMRDAAVERGEAGKILKEGTSLQTEKPTSELTPQQIQQHAKEVRDFIQTHDQLLALEKERRAVELGRDPDATDAEREQFKGVAAQGSEVNARVGEVSPEFAAKLEKEIADTAKADITGAFLDALHEGEDAPEQVIRGRMQAHLGAGAHSHLNAVTLASLGYEGVDRQVVDALGIDAAAQLTAYALRRDSKDLDSVIQGLAQAHDDTSIPKMQEAMSHAQEARAQAAEVELPPLSSATDTAVLRDLQKQRRELLSEAHAALGSALGNVEAGAALNLALKGKGPESLSVRFNEAPTAQVVMQLRALGLQDGEYHVERDAVTNHLTATINQAGMERLTPKLDADQAKVLQEIKAIKSGERDEADYLPAGFMARRESDLNPNPGVPAAFQQEADWSKGVMQAVDDVAASMAADGFKPSDILKHLMDTVSQECPDGQHQAFAQRVTELLPFAATEQRIAKDGTPYTAHVARDIDHDPQIKAQLEGMSHDYLAQHHPGETDFHNQSVPDDDRTREALFHAIAERPALQAAFAPAGDIGGTKEGRVKARAIKGYFFGHVVAERLGGKSPEVFDEEAKKARNEALSKLGPAPEKWGQSGGMMFDMGGGDDAVRLQLSPHATPEQHASALTQYGLRPEHYEIKDSVAVLTEAGKAALRMPSTAPTVDGTPESPEIVSGGFDQLNPDWVRHQRKANEIVKRHQTTADLWNDFKETMRGSHRAYAAVQEVMQGDLLTRFAHHHAQLTGQQLRVSKVTTQHWEKRLAATDPAEAERIRQRDRKIMDEVRTRDSSGRYLNMGEGGLAGAVQEKLEKQAQQANMMGSLFGLDTGKHGGEVTAKRPHDLDIGAHERLALGHVAEGQIGRIVNGTKWGLKATDGSPSIIKNLTWGAGTKHVTKQRLVKMLLSSGRAVGWLGAGSGKTGTMLGAFTQAHAEGKARKALYVVPSIVRNQFGEAAASFTKPGQYSWHAEDASYDERKAHYSGDTHMVVVTHQTFRDDMLKLMAEHHDMPVGDFSAMFEGLPREERAQKFRVMLEHHGIPLDMLHVDEAHDFLNRAGKQDSTMSKVLEAALDNARYKALWTGSPVKNDPSEVHDWLAKVDPKRFADRDEFMRRYGVNTKASAEALQRLVDGYSVIDSVRPDVDRAVYWGKKGEDGSAAPIPLTPQQEQVMHQVNDAFDRCASAQRRGEVDIEAAKILSPRSFEGQDASEHRAVAARLQSALGTLRHAAMGRVVNEFEPEHNAKVQHVLSLAEERRGKGGVIFARNQKSIALLKSQLEAQGHRVGVIDGSTTTDEKGKVRNSFDNGDVDIVLCSDAGATGANLQHRGKWLVNYDLPLTQKTLEQRNARIDRLGQTDKIELHHLATNTTYDRDNIKRLQRKEELGSILQGEYRDMEDTGLAGYIRRARIERDEGWDNAPHISENAKPADPKPDVPEVLPDIHPDLASHQPRVQA